MYKTVLYLFILSVFFSSQVLAQWMDSSDGLTPNQLYNHEGVRILKKNSNTIYAATFKGVFYSTDSGVFWNEMPDGLPFDANIEELECNESAVLIQAKTVVNSMGKYDILKWNGTTWQIVLANDSPLAEPIATLIYSGTDWYAKTTGQLLKSSDNGDTWLKINSQIFPGNLPDNGHFLAYRNGKMYLGEKMGVIAREVFVSNDDGLNWSQIAGIQGGYFSQTSEAIYVVGDSIFKSSDDFASWSVIHCNPRSLSLWVSGDTLVQSMAGGNGSANYSIDGGITWNPYNDGLPTCEIRNIISFDGKFLAGVSGTPLFTSAGVYVRSIDFSTTAVENETTILNSYQLSQNYPNPFNPSTTIKYTVPNVTLSGVEGSRVQLKVYDILGNEVATLVNEEKPAGNYEVNFNADQLPSGVYLYKLQAGNFFETKKMILLK